MQLRSRIGSVCCCVQSRPIGATWKHFTTSSSMSSAEVRNCIDKECEDFLPWLEKKAGVGISSHLTVGKSSYGRCLVASKSIMEGECMLKVPFSVQITEDNMRPEILSMLGDEVGNVTRLALLILIEQKMGEDSEWAPYIRHLPRPGEMHNAVLWSDKELQMVRQSSMFLETAKLKAQLEKDFMRIKRVFQHLPEVFEDVSFHDFIHAYTLVTSRAWERQNCLSLIPFADFVNHDGSSEADLLGDIDKQCSEVIADRDYIAGEQVLIRYGKFSNATLLFDFGFTHPNNVYDQNGSQPWDPQSLNLRKKVCIELCTPAWDPLRSKKIELLQKHCTPAIRDINGFNSSWNSFTIKEVRLNSKIGRGVPQSLRAFARVLCSSSLEEIEDLEMEATDNDGRLARLPLKDASKEFQAHQLLIACIRQHIEDYDESIKCLERLDSSASSAMGASLDIRRNMAKDLLKGELRILNSAYIWLKAHSSKI